MGATFERTVMRVIIEKADFRWLSRETQKELLQALAGKDLTRPEPMKTSPNVLWRQPMDLSPDLAARLLHGLSEPHRVRLELFAKKGGRVTQRELLKVTKDNEMRVLSHFQAVLSRRLRRLLHEPEKRIHLIGWDFNAIKWDKTHTNIINGVYYVTDGTTRTLQNYFGIKENRTASQR